MRILATLSDGKARTLTELSRDIGINSSTTFRLLATLAQYNYVERDPSSGGYRLGLTCLELARAYHIGSDIRQEAMSTLEALRNATTETIHLAILDQMEVVYLEKLQGLHAVGLMSSRVGGRSPAYCTGLGKVLLAYADPQVVRDYFDRFGLYRYTSETIQTLDTLMDHLSDVRARGYSFDRGEHEAEVRCVAAPILDISGQVVAAISISGPAARLDPIENKQDLITRIKEAADTISTKLGFQQSA